MTSVCLSREKYKLTQEKLRQILRYDPETGNFWWLVTKGKATKGSLAGQVRKSGYRRIIIDGQEYRAAQLAWFYMTGSWSTQTIDHLNRKPADDRWNNLREATGTQQNINRKTMKNNTSGVTGVKRYGRGWVAYMTRQRKKRNLGIFDTLESATEARRRAELEEGEWKATDAVKTA